MQDKTLWGISCTTSTAVSESTFQGICLSAWTMKQRLKKSLFKENVFVCCDKNYFYRWTLNLPCKISALCSSLTFFAVSVTVIPRCTITDVWCITRSAILTIRVTRCYQRKKHRENYIKKNMRGEVQKPAVFISRSGHLLIWNPCGRLSFEFLCISTVNYPLTC